MTENDFVKAILIKPIFKQLDIGVAKESIQSLIPLAINKITNRFDFTFATGEATVDGGTVVGQSDYELSGDNDARDIINIRYDDDLRLLEKKIDTDMDDLLTWIDTPDDVYAWYRLPDSSGAPMVRLIATPGTAGITIKYRYRKKNIGFLQFPAEWQDVLMDSVMACVGDISVGPHNEILLTGFSSKFESSIMKMIDHYSRPGGESSPVTFGFETKNRNIERNNLHGY